MALHPLLGVVMPTNLKIFVVLLTMPAWLGVVILSLINGEIPSAEFMAIPAGLMAASSGGDIVAKVVNRNRKADDDSL